MRASLEFNGLSELINSYSSWNYQKTEDFLMIPGEIEVEALLSELTSTFLITIRKWGGIEGNLFA